MALYQRVIVSYKLIQDMSVKYKMYKEVLAQVSFIDPTLLPQLYHISIKIKILLDSFKCLLLAPSTILSTLHKIYHFLASILINLSTINSCNQTDRDEFHTFLITLPTSIAFRRVQKLLLEPQTLLILFYSEAFPT